MKDSEHLEPAKHLAAKNDAHFPNASDEYRKARNDLPIEEGDTIRHFYSAEGNMQTADPGQDPHNAPDMKPLRIILDTTPEGCGTDWYPKLDD